MPLTEKTGLSVEDIKAEIETLEKETRQRLRHLRALLRCLEDEDTEK